MIFFGSLNRPLSSTIGPYRLYHEQISKATNRNQQVRFVLGIASRVQVYLSLYLCLAHQKGLIVDAFKFPVLMLLDEIAHAFQEASYSSLGGFSPRKRRRQAPCVYRTLRDGGGTPIPLNRWQRGVERKRQTNQQSCDHSRVLPCFIPRDPESDTPVTGFDRSGSLVYCLFELLDLKSRSGTANRCLSGEDG